MPRSTNPDWIDWPKSEAQKIVLDDLESGFLPIEDDLITAEVAWMHYVELPEFVTVAFDQFKARLIGHRAQVKKKKDHINRQMNALTIDRQLHPTSQVDRKGRQVFYLSDAARFLEQDIQNEAHKEYGVEGLYYTREEYFTEWDLALFKDRVRQEEGKQKFFYFLEYKRAKKEAGIKDKQGEVSGFDSESDDGNEE